MACNLTGITINIGGGLSPYNVSLCDQGCVVLAIDKTYLGPGAFTKAFRTVHDSRDTRYRERLDLLSQKRGMWDCAHCFEATECFHCAQIENLSPHLYRSLWVEPCRRQQ